MGRINILKCKWFGLNYRCFNTARQMEHCWFLRRLPTRRPFVLDAAETTSRFISSREHPLPTYLGIKSELDKELVTFLTRRVQQKNDLASFDR